MTKRRSHVWAFKAWVNQQDIQTLYLTAISLAELRVVIALLSDGETKTDLSDRLNRMLALVFLNRILPFTTEAARAFAEREWQAQGKRGVR
jgi:predicted nucleic acid-binding protein